MFLFLYPVLFLSISFSVYVCDSLSLFVCVSIMNIKRFVEYINDIFISLSFSISALSLSLFCLFLVFFSFCISVFLTFYLSVSLTQIILKQLVISNKTLCLLNINDNLGSEFKPGDMR